MCRAHTLEGTFVWVVILVDSCTIFVLAILREMSLNDDKIFPVVDAVSRGVVLCADGNGDDTNPGNSVLLVLDVSNED